MKAKYLFYIPVIFVFAACSFSAESYDETRFFTTEPPEMVVEESEWTVHNKAISIQVRYDPVKGSFLLAQIEDLRRNKKILAAPSPLLVLTGPDERVLLDLSEGWKMVSSPTELAPRKNAKGRGVMGLDFVLQSKRPPSFATEPIILTIRLNVFPGDEPYVTLEPIIKGGIRQNSHVRMVQYAALSMLESGKWKAFGGYSNHHTYVTRNGDCGLWVSMGNYNPNIKTADGRTCIRAEANVYLDQYLFLSDGSLGTWMLGVHSGSATEAQYDYQLFLAKRWVAGDHTTIAPHYQDHWYSTRRGVTAMQPPRMKEMAPIIKESGFHFFWFIFDKHGHWPDWRHTPEEYFPGGVDAENPASVAGVLANEGVKLGLYTAPARLALKVNYHLQHDKCREYGSLLGMRSREAKAVIWWYEDYPGENYQIKEDLPNQPKGNCSWMWRQGYMIVRREIKEASPSTSICRTWVEPVEQLGWAEACACLDVSGSKGGNQSGGETRAADFSLVDNWRNTIWKLVPVWPVMNHIGQHPVHIRDENRKPSDSDYINSSAAMMGPFVLNGPISQTTTTERSKHRKWVEFNWRNREFLRFSFLPEFVGERRNKEVDGIYHLGNPDETGLCGFIGLWNKDDVNTAEVTMAVPLKQMRLRWQGDMVARSMNSDLKIPVKRDADKIILGPVKMDARDWQIIEVRVKK